MKSLRTLLLIFCVMSLCTISIITMASANELEIQHTLSDVTATETGNDVTLEMTITNTGDSALSDISIAMLGPLMIGDPDMQSLSVSSLSAGETSSVSWTISTIILEPEEKIAVDLMAPILLDVSATDVNGETVHPMAIALPSL
ncbi:MAG: hypothetical protein HON76_10265 [Candidatus Scalindua sp.]|nr:hypothetical protein [Candidatus Scalindua sp.]